MTTQQISRNMQIEITGTTGVPSGKVRVDSTTSFTLDATSVGKLGTFQTSPANYWVSLNSIQVSTTDILSPKDGTYSFLAPNGSYVTSATLS